ncbi:MAG TPA: hypothetical protein VED84_04915 [Acidimicrobiales bacterium]|nr:hypothetical protein [Acidimicrobiales bacterium]
MAAPGGTVAAVWLRLPAGAAAVLDGARAELRLLPGDQDRGGLDDRRDRLADLEFERRDTIP